MVLIPYFDQLKIIFYIMKIHFSFELFTCFLRCIDMLSLAKKQTYMKKMHQIDGVLLRSNVRKNQKCIKSYVQGGEIAIKKNLKKRENIWK